MPCLLEKFQLQNLGFHRDEPREEAVSFKCPVCGEAIKHHPMSNLLVQHATMYLPDIGTGKFADMRPKLEGAWAQLFSECRSGRPGQLT